MLKICTQRSDSVSSFNFRDRDNKQFYILKQTTLKANAYFTKKYSYLFQIITCVIRAQGNTFAD